MSNLTDYAENALVDWFRGSALTLPTNWHVALGSAASDTSFTEITGTDYARQPVARSLAAWSGTQGAGSTLASNGTSHQTSTNAVTDFGDAGSAWGSVTHVGLFDASTAGECWFWAPLVTPMTVDNGDPVTLAAGLLRFTVGASGGLSDFAANKVVDLVFRAQAWDWPASYWVAYTRTAPTNGAVGSEPSGGGYARQEVDKSFADWSAAGVPGDTGASAGTSGRTSNNDAIEWAVPTANQGTVTHVMLMDAETVGNLLMWRAMASAKSLTPGGLPPRFDPDTLGVTFA